MADLAAYAEFSEADIAAEIKKFLEAEGWTMWAEAHRIDLVGKQGDDIIGVEVKKKFTHDLVAQGLQAASYCGAAYIAMPRVANSASHYVLEAVLEKSGLGCLEVWDWGYATTAHPRFEIKRTATPTRRHAGLDCVKKLLVPEALNWTTAGHPACRSVTAFRVTALRIRDYVNNHVGCTVREVLDEVPHHWGSKASAQRNLLVCVEKGAVDGVKMVTKHGAETALVPA